MSGIVGFIYFDRRIISTELDTMIDKIKHRGPDGIDVWEDDNAGLAHLMMHITPESIYEKQPLVSDSGLVLVADARIDNREELIEILSLKRGIQATDSELIMAAYEHWGDDCLHHLIGDFAFAIWDKKKQRVFAGRDHMGVRPLYYHYVANKVFAFASEMKALLALDIVPEELNELEIASYLAAVPDFRPLTGRTIYKNICTLKPANVLTVNNESIAENFCWDLDLQKFSHLKTDDDFVNAFKKTFIEAVHCRIRTPFEVASHLSGGLDSSSIACIARNILREEDRQLHTFHMDVELDRCNEKEYAETVIEQGGIKHQYTKTSDFDFYESAEEVAQMTDRPNSYVVVPSAQIGWMKAAQQANVRVFLTGHEGDTVVDYGFGHLTNSLLDGQYKKFEELLSQLSQFAINYNYFDSIADLPLQEKLDFVRKIVIHPVLTQLKSQKKYGKILNIFLKTNRSGKLIEKLLKDRYTFLKTVSSLFNRKNLDSRYSILNKDFRNKTKVEKTINQELETHNDFVVLSEVHKRHFRKLYSFGMTHFCEILEHSGVHHNFKMAHPFLDKRVLELAMVLPSHLNFNNGMMRGTLREAMRGILPEKIRSRTIKMDFSPLLLHTLKSANPTFKAKAQQYFENTSILNDYINQEELLKRIEICFDDNLSNEFRGFLILQIFRSIYFATFYSQLNSIQNETSKKLHEAYG